MQQSDKFVRIQVEKIQTGVENAKPSSKNIKIKSLFQKKHSLSDEEKKARDKYLMDKLVELSSKNENKYNIEPKINFQRGLKPERINEFILLEDYLMAMVKWKDTVIVDPVLYEELKEKYPQIVLNYFQSKMTKRKPRPRQPRILNKKNSQALAKKSS